MATTTRQTNLLVNQDWTKIYQSFREADFQSYDFQTLRKSMIDYLRTYYPEDYNDFIESSEYIALIDLIAFLGQSLAFRADLNARENFIDTAERRDSVLKLAKLISYSPKRNQPARGLLKINSITTTEHVYDSNGLDLSNLIIKWNDSTNINWLEQFTNIVNSSLANSQQIGAPSNTAIISEIAHEEYQINTLPGTVPVYKFSASIENTSFPFEIVSATFSGQNYIYEPSPRPGSALGLIYKNDNLGNNSVNTGFFLQFKQGNLNSLDFTLADSLPNRVVNVNFDNINNSDVWLYDVASNGQVNTEWTKVPTVNAANIIYNNNANKNSFQINTRNNDQIDLVFGDGTFAATPQGIFRCYYRQSNGLSYKITPAELQNIQIPISYISRAGRIETLTITASLQYTVANSVSRETINEIRTKAPQQYYTQNRMVTGEDYNIFPYTNFNTISKVKAVNRTSSGVSRFLDVVDVTGKYSSTNVFGQDGYLYEQAANTSFNFSWTTTNEINQVISNRIIPFISGAKVQHFYYKNFDRFDLTNLYWNQVNQSAGQSTGYFTTADSTIAQVGSGISGTRQYVTEGSIVVFAAPTGYYFNKQNEIKVLPDSGLVPTDGKTTLYAAVVKLISNGDTDILTDGTGSIGLSVVVPSTAIATTVIPYFSNDFTTSFTQLVINQITNYKDFGIRYDIATQSWAIVESQNLNTTDSFSLGYAGSTSGLNLDSSWIIAFRTSGPTYTVTIRGLDYVFESSKETKFYFDNTVKVFDPKTGLTVNDQIKVLKVNGDPDTRVPLQSDVVWYIYDQIVESDGYVQNSKVLVTFSDSNSDGVPDDPDIFNRIVSPNVDSTHKLVFFQKTTGYNSFITYEPIDSSTVDSDYATETIILARLNSYAEGQIFYATTDQKFFVLEIVNGARTLVESTDYIVRVGRQDLYFQYRHNSPNYRRIDPSPNNIIDLYILTKSYETDFRTWALDSTGKISQPDLPTSEDLRSDYGSGDTSLEKFKSVSDAIVYNPAKFKQLFGSKAHSSLQATFKVVKNSAVNISDSEIKAQVLAYINNYFDTANWEFGETFYFSELAAYLHSALSPNLASIIIVPTATTSLYGSLQQITASPDEILISCATVENIEVIDAITASQINLQINAVNTVVN